MIEIFNNIKKQIKISESKRGYDEILNRVIWWLDGRSTKEKLLLLDYLIDVLLEDICSSGVVKPLISRHASPFINCFPTYCFDKNGSAINIRTEEKIEVDLSKTRIYVCPWNKLRIPDNLFNLMKKPFTYDKNNHFSDFYSDINLCHVYNGNHSIHIGNYLKEGKITSEICHTELLYPNCRTDGLFWYDVHSGQKIMNVDDFRLAAVYSLAKMRYYLRKRGN